MNWRRGLFRLWMVGAALFVIAVAFIDYRDITQRFDDAWVWEDIVLDIPLAVFILAASLGAVWVIENLEKKRIADEKLRADALEDTGIVDATTPSSSPHNKK